MEEQFQYLVKLATEYERLANDDNALFEAINKLPNEELQKIYENYYSKSLSSNEFKPVNFIRAVIAKNCMEGKQVNIALLKEIKDAIVSKDENYFSIQDETLLDKFRTFTIGKRGPFTSWKRNWSIFFVYFYKNEIVDIATKKMTEIANELIKTLGLDKYSYHLVDSNGPQNFGSTYFWLAIYPGKSGLHREFYQFFVQFQKNSYAGRIAGSYIKNPVKNKTEVVKTFAELVTVLQSQKKEIESLNTKVSNYYHFAPGPQAIHWEKFKEEKVIAVNFSNLLNQDISIVKSLQELNILAGLDSNSNSKQTFQLWSFLNASIGDVVFVNKGVNVCIGIGVITSDYYFEESEFGFNHKRNIEWLTFSEYQYTSFDYKNYTNLFVPDTFSRTLIYSYILQQYILIDPSLEAIFQRYNFDYTSDVSYEDFSSEVDESIIVSNSANYWWLNANPNIWSISSMEIGERQTYTTVNDNGSKRKVFKYFREVKPNDVIIGYESSPTMEIKAILKVTKELHTYINEDIIEFAMMCKLSNPIKRSEFSDIELLQNMESLRFNQGSLFKVTSDEFTVLQQIIEEKNGPIFLTDLIEVTEVLLPYDFATDPDKPFISEEVFLKTVELLERKKNIILQGPPGVGKTFIAQKLAYQKMGYVDDYSIAMVQFHQSFSYEDFIQGLRPKKDGGFELKNGIFYTFVERALQNPNKDFFFIIDEINRGNLSKIFGELMMLIEADKRKEKYKLQLTYSGSDDEKFYIPENVHIIGTMNTADRSLAIVDYALRRRFAFVNLEPLFEEAFKDFLSSRGVPLVKAEKICASIIKVNEIISKEQNLGTGFQIGHSYFCSQENIDNVNDWFKTILEFEIKPLLEEIFFDDEKNHKECLSILQGIYNDSN
ncbi:MAG: EVE domain-containing protein [Candidatus Kapabacteria bacterium]|nr:EVE domain-containing protein [Candidatus Kapabacteria bacterium]